MNPFNDSENCIYMSRENKKPGRGYPLASGFSEVMQKGRAIHHFPLNRRLSSLHATRRFKLPAES